MRRKDTKRRNEKRRGKTQCTVSMLELTMGALRVMLRLSRVLRETSLRDLTVENLGTSRTSDEQNKTGRRSTRSATHAECTEHGIHFQTTSHPGQREGEKVSSQSKGQAQKETTKRGGKRAASRGFIFKWVFLSTSQTKKRMKEHQHPKQAHQGRISKQEKGDVSFSAKLVKDRPKQATRTEQGFQADLLPSQPKSG